MDLTPEIKAYIDSLSYEQLSRQYFEAPAGNLLFEGHSGQYWRDRMDTLWDADVDTLWTAGGAYPDDDPDYLQYDYED